MYQTSIMGKNFGVGPEQGSLETLENKGHWKKPECGGNTFQSPWRGMI